ncbi:hypothetical protein [Streptomyces pseudogriseolus]|uniref:hypothetical protein n=1 Tax=Streptomyces pseudogriseolus TaxID=36817 RepID=UPI003474A974
MNPGRYRVTVVLDGRRTLRGWWNAEPVARRQFAGLVGQYGRPGAHVILADEETGETLTEWPDGA